MVLVAPSMLAADFLRLEKEVELVNRCGDLFHLDIMDGTFVPNISFGFPVVHAIAGAAKKPMDAHLMIVNPGKYIERFAGEGISMLSFHLEAAGEGTGALLEKIRGFGMKAGLAINPDIPVESLFPYIEDADFFLIMSVFAGFGGQQFIEGSLDRISALRNEMASRGISKDIEVDGGVSAANSRALIDAGATMLVAGSSVFKAEDPAAAIAQLRI
jgi:ribulose-phosphate 3-epimerase